MKNKKIIGLLLSLAMVLGVAMPGTLAVSAETESAAESSVGTNAANEQTSETPLDDVNTDNSSETFEKTATVDGTEITVQGEAVPEKVNLAVESVDPATLDLDSYGIENSENVVTAVDIKLVDGETPVQPEDMVQVTIDADSLGLENGAVVEIMHDHYGEISSLGQFTVTDGKITFDTDKFSIYVVVGNYSNDWNYNNYKIVMSVGDTMSVKTSNSGNSYSWSIVPGNNGSFTLSNTTSQQASITANAAGTTTLQCQVRQQSGEPIIDKITVVALDSVGSSVNDDIIFANIAKDYQSGDTEYENTYGPYVMKIRFEDTDGKLLKYADDTTVGDDYYVFDSKVGIDVNTFAAAAPDGYTYAGAFFYWNDHNDFDGFKVYVTSVERRTSESYGSYLWYGGTHNTTGSGSWAYQAFGVLHIVYAPTDEVHKVTFKDHCGYELANYAVKHNDRGVEFPSGYVANIDNLKNTVIPNHHTSHDSGYNFDDKWVVYGGGNDIDGTYTTEELKAKITTWTINSNITITAQCSESTVTINYVAKDGGTVSYSSETLAVASGTAQGSAATPNTNYKFVGWFDNQACTGTPLSTEASFVPQKPNSGWVDGTTYYAKFELDVFDLTIIKTGTQPIDENQAYVFNVTGNDGFSMDVVIQGDDSVIIKDLTVSEYTVTEDTKWSWRYKPKTSSITITPQNIDSETHIATASFENVRAEKETDSGIWKWLNGCAYTENIFKGES